MTNRFFIPMLVMILLVVTFSAPGEAAHTAAWIQSENQALELALKRRGVQVRTMDNDTSLNTLDSFIQTIPTKGIVIIYASGKTLEPDHLLKRLIKESGAAFLIVMIEGEKQGVGPLPENAALYFVTKPFKEILVRELNSSGISLGQAIHTAATESLSWCSKDSALPIPQISRAVRGAEQIGNGTKPGDEWVNALGMIFNWCPRDKLTGFWLGKYEVTKREFNLVTYKKPKHAMASHPNHPRDSIRYDDILLFINELNRREQFFKRLPVGWEYALPSPAEWELACRAGTGSAFYFDLNSSKMPDYANFADASLLASGEDDYHYADGRHNDGHAYLALVGSYQPNPWGFYDMLGNLWEWTSRFETEKQSRTEEKRPIAKGGSWVSIQDYCRPEFSHHFKIETQRNFIGFRLMLHNKIK